MPSNATAKIKLAPKRALVVIALLVVCSIGVAIHAIDENRTATLRTDKGVRRLEVVDTTMARSKGLGNRSSMPTGQGMLFVYDHPSVNCFWMKDMHFSLDMIWLDTDRTVIHIEKHVSPATFPTSFCPAGMSQYVIELNAGQADALGVKVGDRLRF